MTSSSRNIAEIITIYRRMKKGRENQCIYRQMLNVVNEDERTCDVEMVSSNEQRMYETGDYVDDRNRHDGATAMSDHFVRHVIGSGCLRDRHTDRDGHTDRHADRDENNDSNGYADRDRHAVIRDDHTDRDDHVVSRNGHAVSRDDHFYNFGKYKNVEQTKVLLYSKEAGLVQADSIESVHTSSCECYWLSIFDPTETELVHLSRHYHVHDITLNDIREKNTKEKVEIFHNYTFISIRLFSERRGNECITDRDIDFNILLFKNHIVTLHDSRWNSISDILNFLTLIAEYTTMWPEWVLFSIVVEFLQDVRFLLDRIVPDITAMQNSSHSVKQSIGDLLKENFVLTNSVCVLRRSIKPKIHILDSIVHKCRRRLRRSVLKHISFTYQDFLALEKEMRENSRLLERCQDLFLALVNMEQSREGNEMNKVMKRFTIITFIFLPMQTVAGLWGMNVKVPFQEYGGLLPFVCLVIAGSMISIMYFMISRKIYKLLLTG